MGQVRSLPVIYGQKNFSPHQESNLLEIDFSSLILRTGEKSVFKTVIKKKKNKKQATRQPEDIRPTGQQCPLHCLSAPDPWTWPIRSTLAAWDGGKAPEG